MEVEERRGEKEKKNCANEDDGQVFPGIRDILMAKGEREREIA